MYGSVFIGDVRDCDMAQAKAGYDPALDGSSLDEYPIRGYFEKPNEITVQIRR